MESVCNASSRTGPPGRKDPVGDLGTKSLKDLRAGRSDRPCQALSVW